MDNIWDVIIIGSGPSALTSAIYTTRGSLKTLILGGEKWGGQLMLTTTVDNFPGFYQGVEGPELMSLMRKQAERFGAKFLEKNAIKVDFSKKPFEITSDQLYLGKSVIIATGAETKWLDAPGISKFIGRGVSSCAPCDAPFFRDKTVFVVGGGDSAMEEALVLTKFAKEVTIIHRRDSFRATSLMQQKVFENKKIKVMLNSELTEVKGNQKVESITTLNNKDNTKQELQADGIFVAIGHMPVSEIFKGQVETDEKGFVLKKPNDKYQMSTSVSGVFVAGDVHDSHYKQAITAAGFGCMAALDIISYLDNI